MYMATMLMSCAMISPMMNAVRHCAATEPPVKYTDKILVKYTVEMVCIWQRC